MDKNLAIISVALIGLLVGFMASVNFDSSKAQCEKTEDEIRGETDVSGALACFEPGIISVNRSERVEEGSNLECVCRQSFEGNVWIFAINKAR